MNAVSVVSCSSYDEQEVFKAIKKAIEDIGFELPTGKRVLVKPNIMSQNRPDQHTITHYTVVDAICRLLYERNNTILIGESISFFQKGLTKIAFETSGISEVAEKYGATLIEFEKEELVKVTSGIRSLNEIIMPKLLMEVDMVINACKLKTHMAMRLSGAVKNMFGCLPGGYKQKIHIWTKDEFELSDVFVDIHNIIKPSLSVMDAVIGLDGGPTALGRKVKIGKILASENAAALDIVAARMIGYQEGEVPLLTQAVRRGMIDNFDDVMIEGDIQKVEFKRLVTADIHRKNDPDSVFVKDTYVDLDIDDEMCDSCGTCVRTCPVHALEQSDGKVSLNREQCINCYHCLLICKNDAIIIKPTLMNLLGWGIRKVTGL